MVLIRDTDAGRRPPLRTVAGIRDAVALWMLERLPEVTDLPGGYEAIGVARGDELVGGCLYSDYRPATGGGSIQMWAAGHDWLSRRVLRELLGYPFLQLGCHRVMALVGRKNKPSRTMVEKLGFRLEGVAREGFGPRRDAFVYAMLRHEAGRWIDG